MCPCSKILELSMEYWNSGVIGNLEVSLEFRIAGFLSYRSPRNSRIIEILYACFQVRPDLKNGKYLNLSRYAIFQNSRILLKIPESWNRSTADYYI